MVKNQTKKSEQKSSRTDENLQVQFDTLVNSPVKPQTRKVELITQSCCGCGCSDVTILREVEYDSPLQNGDRVGEILSTDKYLR